MKNIIRILNINKNLVFFQQHIMYWKPREVNVLNESARHLKHFSPNIQRYYIKTGFWLTFYDENDAIYE